jgi:hypothetical protein
VNIVFGVFLLFLFCFVMFCFVLFLAILGLDSELASWADALSALVVLKIVFCFLLRPP